MEFTEEEVRQKLHELGYVNIPKLKLLEFMKDLQELILHEESLQTITSTDDIHKRTRPVAFSMDKPPTTFKHVADDREDTYYSDNSEMLSSTVSSYTDSEYKSLIKDCQTLANNTENYPFSVRRKVSRKKNGRTHIYDETYSESGSSASDITALEDRLRSIPLEDVEGETTSISSASLKEDQKCWDNPRSQQALPAFIRSSTAHPHTKGLRKCDPVSRYHQFKDEWKANKVPGESKHSSLRWSVREHMLNYEVYEKPRHRFSANNYVVPTEKKRQALRWQVRTALANI